MRLAAVITARNEGEQVRRTVRSLRDSVERADLLVIVVDDGSQDASCAHLDEDVLLIRHERPQGVGRSRNRGWRAAREAGCDVVSFHDAHMRFPAGGLEALARRALEEPCIACAGSAGYRPAGGRDEPVGCRLFGCDLFWNPAEGLQARWSLVGKAPPEQWHRSPCPMGAGYAMSARTAESLEAATDRLWEDTAGQWGFSEQALAVKAFLLDVPVLFGRDVVFRHLYRDVNPVPDAGREKWRNVARSTAVLFGPDLFAERFRDWCVRWIGEEETRRLAAGHEARTARLHRASRREPAEVFTHLCGRPDAAVQSSISNPQSPIVTVCLLNYRRPQNLPAILDCLAGQTVPVQVFLWDNSADGLPAAVAGHRLIALVVRSARNLGCWPRWQLAATARTEFVCTLDDDLVPADERVLEDAVAAQREACPDGIVGPFGWTDTGRGFRRGRHHQVARRDLRCDAVKGRFMLTRRDLLARVPLAMPAWDEDEPLGFRCDDLLVSLCLGAGRRRPHLVPGRLGRRWRDLPRRGTGLDTEPRHYALRDRAVRRVRQWLEGRTQ